MKKETIHIENLKCGGCAVSIKKGLGSLPSVSEVNVSLETSQVDIMFDGSSSREVFTEALGKMGYSEKGTGNRDQKVKSYVSCAVGKLNS